VLVNLVDNAVRHARTGVRVTVAPRTLSVADDGPGIAAADRARVFDRFTRLDWDRGRESGGAGLGLAIVRELVQAHGGTVSLEDAAPGLVVTVHFPDPPVDPTRTRPGVTPQQFPTWGKAGDAVRRPPPSGGVSGAVGGSEPEG
jgi:signal transduction histidine kinase